MRRAARDVRTTLTTIARPDRRKTLFQSQTLPQRLLRGYRFIELQAVLAASIGMQTTYPLWDRRIVELCLQVPPEQFLAQGMHRSLLRRAMAGLLPDAIRLRWDKMPYIQQFQTLLRTDIDAFGFGNALAPKAIDMDIAVRNRLESEQFSRLSRTMRERTWVNADGPCLEVGIVTVFLRFLAWQARSATEERRARVET